MVLTPQVERARLLLRFLQREGRLAVADAQRLEEQLLRGDGSIHELLEREGVGTPAEVADVLASALRVARIDLAACPPDEQAVRAIKESVATFYEVVPVRITDTTIEVATLNPLDLEALKAIEFGSGRRVQFLVTTPEDLRDAMAHAYRLRESLEDFLRHVPDDEQVTVADLEGPRHDLRELASEAELPPVVKLADRILVEAIKRRASDVHIEPAREGVLVRYRIDGVLEEAMRLPKWVQSPFVARLKIMAKLDITERRVPQDGRIQLRFQQRLIDLRVSSLPAQHGEKVTLRILDGARDTLTLDTIGLDPRDAKALRAAIRRPQGLILLSGPTGSGKTTTLYAALQELWSPGINIVTIENPVEYQLKGINQVDINNRQGLTFASVLRSVLRQDPDVILVGEIRDAETAEIAIQAAQTGHLVLSTVHTNDAIGVVSRLVDLGVDRAALASALTLVAAQRLVRRVCAQCTAPEDPADESMRRLPLPTDHPELQRGAGCPACRHTGYVGRLGIYEMLPITPSIAKLIERGASESDLRQRAHQEGGRALLEDAVDKVMAGVTTAEEVFRVVAVGDETIEPAVASVASADAPQGAAVPAEAHPADDRNRRFTVLAVDDDADCRDIMEHALAASDLPLRVVTAVDGASALAAAETDRPDVVILDIAMPGIDGLEVCRRLRSDVRTAFVPVLLLTANRDEELVAQGFGVGADDFVTKPFRRDVLAARLRRILQRTYGHVGAGAEVAVAPVAPASTPTATVDGLRREIGRVADEAVTAAGRADAHVRSLGERLDALEGRLAEPPASTAAVDALGAELRDALGAQDRALRAVVAEGLATLAGEQRAVRAALDDGIAALAREIEQVSAASEQAAAVDTLRADVAKELDAVRAAAEAMLQERCDALLVDTMRAVETARASTAERTTAAVRADVAEQGAAVRAEFTQQLDTVRVDVAERVATVRAELAQQLDTVRASVAQQIEAARADFDARIATAQVELARQIDGLRADLGRRLDATPSAALDVVRAEVAKQREELQAWRAAVDTAVAGLRDAWGVEHAALRARADRDVDVLARIETDAVALRREVVQLQAQAAARQVAEAGDLVARDDARAALETARAAMDAVRTLLTPPIPSTAARGASPAPDAVGGTAIPEPSLVGAADAVLDLLPGGATLRERLEQLMAASRRLVV